MPAGLTHMTLSRTALDNLTSEVGVQAKFLLKDQVGPYLMGCVGPDIPYMGNFDDINPIAEFDYIADGLHTDHTIAIPIAGLNLARQMFKDGKADLADSLYAFYLGYFSHIIADGFTHPFIRDRVGDYSDQTKRAHRTLEMKLDVLVLEKYLNIEANRVAPQKDLTFFENCDFKTEIFTSYSKFLKEHHNKDLSTDQLLKLGNGMIRALNVAETSFPKWYSLGLGKIGLAYMDLEDVKKHEKDVRTLQRAVDADEKGIVHNSLSLDDIDVIDDIFPKYYSYMPKVIEATYDFVFNNGPDYTELVPAINLDTGRLLTSTTLTDKPRYWELA